MALPVSDRDSEISSEQGLSEHSASENARSVVNGSSVNSSGSTLSISSLESTSLDSSSLFIPEENITRLSKLETLRPLTENSRILFASFAAINVLCYHLFVRAQSPEVFNNELLLGLFCIVSTLLGVLTLVFSLSDLFRSGFSSLLRGKPSIDSTLMVALSLGMGAILYSLLFDFQGLSRSGFADLYVFVAFLLTVWRFLSTGYSEALGSSLGFDLRRYVTGVDLFSEESSSTQSIPFQSLKEGDRFHLRAGDMVPTDLTILEGSALLNERKFGGKADSHVRTTGQTVFAGSRVVIGNILCEALLRPEDATITNFTAKLKDLLRLSRQQAKAVWKFAPLFNSLLLFLAACSGVYWYQEGMSFLHTIELMMAVLFLSPLLQFLLLVPRLTGLLLTDLFMKGALLKDPETLQKLRKLERLTLYVHEDDSIGEPQACSFEILDNRVDEEGLYAVLLAVLGAVDGQREHALFTYLSENSKVVPLLDVDDLTVYSQYGVCASVRGVEFSIGREGFLIERGVQISASEIGEDTDTEEWMYVALGDALVARAKLIRPFFQDGKELISRLRSLNIRCSLVSDSIDQETLDRVGKITGFDLSQLHGGASQEELSQLCDRGEGGLAVYGTSSVPQALEEKGVSLRIFDNVLWNLDAGDVLLFDKNISVIPLIISSVRRFYTFRNVGVIVLGVLSSLLLVTAVLAILPPMALLLSSMLAASAFGLLTFLFLPELPKKS
ncbi:MAG: hypothetical protein KDD55_08185 [Bdellovibrionales bacterium]|nr:hypothetical protein [Bdellovibrionales bacterium]